MKSIARKALVTALCLTPALWAASAMGQMHDEIELTRAVIQAERKAIITTNMELTAEESEGFWPVYREYRLEMDTVNDRTIRLIEDYAKEYETLSNEMAQTLMGEFIGIEKDALGIKSKYIKKLEKVLAPTKVARFLQLENKMDAVIKYELAGSIPLMR